MLVLNMEEFILIKESWTKKDGLDFILYLEKIKMPRQNENQQKILATNMSCLGIYSKTLHEIANEIAKGNFLSFLDLWLFKYHENVIICGLLLNKIKDFITFKTYL